MEKKVSFLTAAASLVSLMLVISLVISVNSIVSFKFSISGWTKGHSNWSFINSADQIEKLTDLNLHQVLRIQPIFNHSSPNSTAHVRQTIHQILHSRLKVDVWKAHPDHIDALTSDVDQVKKTLRGAFQDVGFYFTIMNHDIKRSIERERRECLSDKEDQLEILSQTPNNFTRFLSFKHIKNRYHRLQAENPDLVSVTVLGYTHEKRELLLVKITGSGGGKETGKKAIYLQA